MRPQLTCRQFVEFLDDYLSGQEPARRRRAFDAHLAGCPSCQRYLSSYREAVRLARAVAGNEEELAAAAPEELVRAILSARRETP